MKKTLKMCMPVNSKYCIVCLLVYLLLPSSSTNSSADNNEKNVSTYIPLREHNQTDPDETPYLQLAPSKDNITGLDEAQPQHYFIQSLMEKYGNGVQMTFDGFEHLLENIGLGNFLQFDHNAKCHRVNGSTFIAFHSDHNHTGEIHLDIFNKSCDDINHHATHSHDHHLLPVQDDARTNLDKIDNDHREDSDHGHEVSEIDHEHESEHGVSDKENTDDTTEPLSRGKRVKKHLIEEAKKECLTPQLILKIFGETDYRYVNEQLFTSLCPVLIYQLDQKLCLRKQMADSIINSFDEEDHYHGDEGHGGAHHHDDHEHEPEAESEATSEFSFSKIPARVWGFSAIAVVVISLVGLLGVAVIPIMQKVFYNHMLQFLVALAVGALSGDALLHLLPHAIEGGHSEEGHGSHDHSTGQGHNLTGVYKGLCGLMGIYFFFLMERILTIFTDIKRKRKQKSKRALKHMKGSEDVGEKLANSDMECGEMMMSIHPNKDQEIAIGCIEALKEYADEAHSEHCKISFENTTTISHQHGGHGHGHHGNNADVDKEEVESMISHNSHGHGHSHCHDGVPNSVSAIAWMVILGDGIHNFSDGLAIGAAFSNSITGGFSTAIAVFCHELPHEIGDFAMLLRAGMSAKQAIIYNCLSSILCFIGMLIGVALGNIQEASLWIFAAVGGMFLYIALVDMLPEMTSVATQKGENPFKHLILQLLGMLLGAGIMLTIALKEDELRTALD